MHEEINIQTPIAACRRVLIKLPEAARLRSGRSMGQAAGTKGVRGAEGGQRARRDGTRAEIENLSARNHPRLLICCALLWVDECALVSCFMFNEFLGYFYLGFQYFTNRFP